MLIDNMLVLSKVIVKVAIKVFVSFVNVSAVFAYSFVKASYGHSNIHYFVTMVTEYGVYHSTRVTVCVHALQRCGVGFVRCVTCYSIRCFYALTCGANFVAWLS